MQISTPKFLEMLARKPAPGKPGGKPCPIVVVQFHKVKDQPLVFVGESFKDSQYDCPTPADNTAWRARDLNVYPNSNWVTNPLEEGETAKVQKYRCEKYGLTAWDFENVFRPYFKARWPSPKMKDVLPEPDEKAPEEVKKAYRSEKKRIEDFGKKYAKYRPFVQFTGDIQDPEWKDDGSAILPLKEAVDGPEEAEIRPFTSSVTGVFYPEGGSAKLGGCRGAQMGTANSETWYNSKYDAGGSGIGSNVSPREIYNVNFALQQVVLEATLASKPYCVGFWTESLDPFKDLARGPLSSLRESPETCFVASILCPDTTKGRCSIREVARMPVRTVAARLQRYRNQKPNLEKHGLDVEAPLLYKYLTGTEDDFSAFLVKSHFQLPAYYK